MFSKGHTWKVLDKGYVKFIGSMGDDEEIVEAARMSTGRGFISWDAYYRCKKCDKTWTFEAPLYCAEDMLGANNHEPQPFPKGDLGFLEYLYSNRHMTPFEMCSLAIEVKAPIFVFREWQRHRTQKFNEFSARYAQMPNEHYIPELDRIVKQSKSNKQASGGEAFPTEYAAQVLAEMERQQLEVYDTYDGWIQAGVANEVARGNTPVSRYSKMRAKTDLRNWLGFLLLRKLGIHSKPQWEISQYADVVEEIIRALYPRTYALFEEHTFYAETFSRTEMVAIRAMIRQLDSSSGSWMRHAEEAGLDAPKQKALMNKLLTT